jgi:hypothetical protein
MGDEFVCVADAAADAGIELHILISSMHRSGALLVIPGTEDPGCWLPEGWERHEPDCHCEFVPVHPDIRPMAG